MATNTTLLIAVTVIAILLLVSIVAVVVFKTRAEGAITGDETDENALHVRH